MRKYLNVYLGCTWSGEVEDMVMVEDFESAHTYFASRDVGEYIVEMPPKVLARLKKLIKDD